MTVHFLLLDFYGYLFRKAFSNVQKFQISVVYLIDSSYFLYACEGRLLFFAKVEFTLHFIFLIRLKMFQPHY